MGTVDCAAAAVANDPNGLGLTDSAGAATGAPKEKGAVVEVEPNDGIGAGAAADVVAASPVPPKLNDDNADSIAAGAGAAASFGALNPLAPNERADTPVEAGAGPDEVTAAEEGADAGSAGGAPADAFAAPAGL